MLNTLQKYQPRTFNVCQNLDYVTFVQMTILQVLLFSEFIHIVYIYVFSRAGYARLVSHNLLKTGLNTLKFANLQMENRLSFSLQAPTSLPLQNSSQTLYGRNQTFKIIL